MAILKGLGLSSAAAAIATASLASSSRSPSSFPLSNAKVACKNRDRVPVEPFASRRPWAENNAFYTIVKRAMAVDAAITEEKASAQESILQTARTGSEGPLSEVMTEFMVDMKCEGCVSSVRKKLEPLSGVKKVEIDLANQVVRVQGMTDLKTLSEALMQTGRKARLIGQGSSDDFAISATVAEFKGPSIYGVVRIVQVSMELARIDASFSGLRQGPHAWSINQYGDLTRGAESTGEIYNPSCYTPPMGDLGILVANANGEAEYSGSKPMLKVADLPGRACVVYETEDKSQPGIAASVIARSAGVGENYKKLCTCDGTVIWDSSNNDFVKLEN